MTRTVEVIDPPEGCIARLRESLVISFALDDAAETFTLVTDYPDRAPGAHRSFLALRFGGVRDFRREAGKFRELQGFRHDYAIGDGVPPIVIQHIRSTAGDHRAFEAWFGWDFGGIAFSYRTLAGLARHGHAENRDGTWCYTDARSGAPFDFARPFADQPFDIP